MTSDAPLPRRRRSDKILPKADLSDPALHTAKELRRTLRILIAATVILYIFLGGVALVTFFQAQSNTRALCTIRQNAVDRVDQTQDFLRNHPNGIPGLSPLDLKRSITTYQNTVRALGDVQCSNAP